MVAKRVYSRGVSNQSHMVLAAKNVHVFVWGKRTGAESLGAAVRFRRADGGWKHLRVVLMQRNQKRDREWSGRPGRWLVRPTLTLFEATSWTTDKHNRRGPEGKSYVRLKACAGGKMLT